MLPFIYWRLDQKPFNDPRVRQAISMGINRDERIKIIHSGRGNYNNAIPLALSGWWLDPRSPDQGPSSKYFKYDLNEARKLSGTGRAFMLQLPWLSIWPGLAISAAVFGFNMLGDPLREELDPRMRGPALRLSG